MREPWVIDEIAFAGAEHPDPGFVAGSEGTQGRPDAHEAAGFDIADVHFSAGVYGTYTCTRR